MAATMKHVAGPESLFTETDVHMSYLPLAHSFERVAFYAMVTYGAKIGFYQGVRCLVPPIYSI